MIFGPFPSAWPGTEPEPGTGTAGTVFPGTEIGTGTVGTVVQGVLGTFCKPPAKNPFGEPFSEPLPRLLLGTPSENPF